MSSDVLLLGVAVAAAPARAGGTTERVSVARDGTSGDEGSGQRGVAISADGRLVAFEVTAA